MHERISELSTVDGGLYLATCALRAATMVKRVNGSETHILWEWHGDDTPLSIDTMLAGPMTRIRPLRVEQALLVIDTDKKAENLPVNRNWTPVDKARMNADPSARLFIEEFAERFAGIGVNSSVLSWPKLKTTTSTQDLIPTSDELVQNYRFLITDDVLALVHPYRDDDELLPIEDQEPLIEVNDLFDALV
jgi:hypothetical protein